MNWLLVLAIAAVLIGLFAWGRSSFVPADKARQLLRQGALVVDVRSPDEFNSGHLPGAVNIPLASVATDVPLRVPDKSQALLLHCLSGTRSGIAAQRLKGMGYLNVFNLGSYSRAEKIVRGLEPE
jgi:phage shock protein E